MNEYTFHITIEGLDGHLTYSVDAETLQEAKDMVSFFISSTPKEIEHIKTKEYN
jgi:hypothetical protein